MSKRHGAASVGEYRRKGVPPEAIVNALVLLGWAPGADRTLISMEELLREFDLRRVQRSAAIFDPSKLDWISGQYLHRMPPESLADGLGRRLAEIGWLPFDVPEAARGWLTRVADLGRAAVDHLDQAPGRREALFLPRGLPASEEGAAALREEGAGLVLRALDDALAGGEPSTRRDGRL